MRRAPILSILILTALPVSAFAQEEFPRAKDTAKEGPKDQKGASKDQPKASSEVQATSGQQGRFQIRRGFFAEADLGMFLTFNGRNIKDMALPKRFSSNIEPHLGVNIGYDVAHSEGFNLAIAVRAAMGFNSGLARVSDAEFQTYSDPGAVKAGQPDPTTKSSDYTVSELGLLAAASIMMNDRVALIIRADGGLGVLDPDPSKAAATLDMPCPTGMQANGCNLPGAGSLAFVPTFGVGVGGEYYTLLNDFSIGLLIRFQAIMAPAPAGMIPAATITLPVKYTF